MAEEKLVIASLLLRIEQLEADTKLRKKNIIALKRYLDKLREEFNHRPEKQQLEKLQGAVRQLSAQIAYLQERLERLPDASAIAPRRALEELRQDFNHRPERQQLEKLRSAIALATAQISDLQKRLDLLPDPTVIVEREIVDNLQEEFNQRPEIEQLENVQRAIARLSTQIADLQGRWDMLPDFSRIPKREFVDSLREEFNNRPEIERLRNVQLSLAELVAQVADIQQRVEDLPDFSAIAASKSTKGLDKTKTARELLSGSIYIPMTAEEFLRRVREGERNFTGINLTGANLSKTSLKSDVNLSNVNLSGANLSQVSWSNVNLSGADLSAADISMADLSSANLSEANLDDANLEQTKLDSATLEKATLQNANLRSAVLYGSANLTEANLSGANLSKANLRQAKLIRAQLNNANLSKAKLIEANLEEAILEGANLQHAVYNLETNFPTGFDAELAGAYSLGPGASLQNADLAGINLSNVNLNEADLQGASLHSTNLENADLNEANLSGADLSKANLQNARLVQANLSEANLSKACLNNANLTAANLSNANLIQAQLQAANLTAADLSKANLRNAELDDYFHRTNLSAANLSGANLIGLSLNQLNLNGANLSEANLCGVALSKASLIGAILIAADLRGANLEKANMQAANLQDADMSGANLSRTNLSDAIMPDGIVYQ